MQNSVSDEYRELQRFFSRVNVDKCCNQPFIDEKSIKV